MRLSFLSWFSRSNSTLICFRIFSICFPNTALFLSLLYKLSQFSGTICFSGAKWNLQRNHVNALELPNPLLTYILFQRQKQCFEYLEFLSPQLCQEFQ